MAQQRVGNMLGVAAANVASGSQRTNMNGDGTSPQNEHALTNMLSNTQLRARLTAISATAYPSATLDVMTRNDMIYAVRVSDFPATIKQ